MTETRAAPITLVMLFYCLFVTAACRAQQVPAQALQDNQPPLPLDPLPALLEECNELEKDLAEAEHRYLEFRRNSPITGEDFEAPKRRLEQIGREKMTLMFEQARISAMLKSIQTLREQDADLLGMIILVKRTDPSFRDLDLDDKSQLQFLRAYENALSSQLMMLNALIEEFDNLAAIQEKESKRYTVFIIEDETHRSAIERKSRLHRVLTDSLENARNVD